MLSESVRPVLLLEIDCLVPQPVGLRADRLLASELRLPRSEIRRLVKAAQVLTIPAGVDLRRPLRDGMRLTIDASSISEEAMLIGPRASRPAHDHDADLEVRGPMT